MIRRNEPALVAYLAENPSGARLVLREVPDPERALRAMRRAAAAVWDIPHPDEPDQGLPNLCSASLDEGLPVLLLDVKDYSDYAGRIAAAILTALDAEGVEGRLEPFPWPGPPFDRDGRTGIFEGAEELRDLDERGLPPAFPHGLPVPRGWTLVMAEVARTGGWLHVGWRRHADEPPFAEYLERLRGSGAVLDRHPDEVEAEENGLFGYTFRHPDGTGAVWLYHEGLRSARRRGRGTPRAWYLSVLWKPADGAGEEPLPLPVWLVYKPDTTEGEAGGAGPALERTDQGLLYEPGVRALLGPLLEPAALVHYETSFALGYAANILDGLVREPHVTFAGDEWILPLLPLRHHRAGLPMADLMERLTEIFAPEDPDPFVAEQVRRGRLATSAGAGDQAVWFSEDAHRVVDGHLGRLAQRQASVLAGVAPEALALIRHTCLRLAVRRSSGGAAGADLAEEDGLLYHPGMREFLGPVEPDQLRCLEAVIALSEVARRAELPRRLRLDPPTQTLLWLHQVRDDGLPVSWVVADPTAGDLAAWLAEGERAGALTRASGTDGDLVRLTERGHRHAAGYLAALTAELAARFDGLDIEHLAMVRDACWRLVRARHDDRAPTAPDGARPGVSR